MVLIPTQKVHGACIIRPQAPDIEEHRDVVFVPNTAETGRAWGVFDAAGGLVPAAGFYQGANHALAMQETRSNLDLSQVTEEAPDDVYWYCGCMHGHYGHFLLSTLSRFWPFATGARGSAKVLLNAGTTPAEWLASPHVAFAFRGLGLQEADLVSFRRPTRIRRLLIPLPAFEEEHFAHAAFADMCHSIGQAGVPGAPLQGDRAAPVYLSKTRLPQGVWRFDNEDAVTETLAREGMEIVFPEQLGMAEQVGLFRDRAVVCGAVGSAFHTGVFTPPGARILAYNRDDTMLSNYLMLDAINQTQASYVYSESGFTVLPASGAFSLECRLADPVQVAQDLLRLIDARQANSLEFACR